MCVNIYVRIRWMCECRRASRVSQRENFLGLKAGRASWCVAVLSSSIGASSSAEPHFFLDWNSDANFLFLFRSLAWVTWNSETKVKWLGKTHNSHEPWVTFGIARFCLISFSHPWWQYWYAGRFFLIVLKDRQLE